LAGWKKTEIDPVTHYARKVIGGEILAGPHVVAACERHLNDLKNGPKRGLFWNLKKAIHAINFFKDNLPLPGEGDISSKPFILQPSQEFIVGSIFGWLTEDGSRRFQTAYIEEGKGNGKTPMAAGIGLYGLCADREMGAEIYAAAVTREQAGILFKDAKLMRDNSPSLKKRIDATTHNLAFIRTNSFFRPVSSEGRSLDGKRVHFALIDEIHEHRTDVVVEKMSAGIKGRRQPLIFEITNSGYDQESICYRHHKRSIDIVHGMLEDDSWFAYVCGLEEEEEEEGWRNPKLWIKANPLLDIAVTRRYLAKQVREAESMPSKAGIVKRLNFCIWTKSLIQWIKPKIWKKNAGDVDPELLKGKKTFAGLDLSGKNDLSALILVIPVDGLFYVICYFWAPEEGIAEREFRDGAPYVAWEQKKFLKTTPGPTVDYGWIAQEIKQICNDFEIVGLAYDRWGFKIMKKYLDDAGVKYYEKEKETDEGEGVAFIPFGQGYASMSPAITAMEDALLEGQIRHGMHPVLTWNAANAELSQDPAGNRKIVKGKNPSKRVDGIVALAMAMSLAKGVKLEPKGPSIYETRGLATINIERRE